MVRLDWRFDENGEVLDSVEFRRRTELFGEILLAGSRRDYQIPNSLLFRGSQYFSRTPSIPGDRQKFAISAWVRRAKLGTYQQIFSVSDSTPSSDNNFFSVRFDNSTDAISITGWSTAWRTTSSVYRDVGAWYHVVVSVDSTTQTLNLYVNGVQVTSFSTNNAIPLNHLTAVNMTYRHCWGARGDLAASNYLDGTIAEPILVDGAALAPSYFGETDPITGSWRPKSPAISSWGTNGCYLGKPWNAADLGNDYSGQNNDWTPTGFVSTDVVGDTPTSVYATMNPVDKAVSPGTLRYGNLSVYVASGPSYDNFRATHAAHMPVYFEFFFNANGGPENHIGMVAATSSLSASSRPDSFYAVMANGNKWSNAGGSVALGSAYVAADATNGRGMCAFDPATGKLWFGRGGAWFGSGDPAAGTNPAFTLPTSALFMPHVVAGYTLDIDMNFGQREFAYTPPAGFKALCTANLPTPTSAAAKSPWKYYSCQTVVHNGTSTNFTLGWNPDPTNNGSHTLFRVKPITAGSWNYFDTKRGLDKVLWETTSAEETVSKISAAASGVCSLLSGYAAGTYLVEAWRVAPEAGFDIVLDTGTGIACTVAHGNGSTPAMIVRKCRDATNPWVIGHTSAGWSGQFNLDATAWASNSGSFNSTSPTATEFTVGADSSVNQSAKNFVTYVWSPVPGFSAFGKWTNNGSIDGPFISLPFVAGGFTAKTNSASDWYHTTTEINLGNPAVNYLALNTNAAQGTSGHDLDIDAAGVKLRTINDPNYSTSATYYATWAKAPLGASNITPATAR